MQANSPSTLEALLSPDEAAQMLGISKRTLEGYVRAQKIPYVKLGHLTKFRPTSLQAWIAAQEVRALADSSRE